MELKTKLYLIDDEGEKFMGIGVLWLLQQVREQKSLRKAASELELSYSKAFAMIRNLEKNLGVAVLDRKKGGANRDGATLTPFAEAFISLYESFELGVKKQAAVQYDHFGEQLFRLLDSTDKSNDIHGGSQ
ncbi:LysR family transcriptional regulator [uncultured Sphaerochaeta sp.]|uniref:winged helix-turn-helix domain-containing protein n=1 Tax=uncultured Sphaerochaeta sp. TaxID=886478 RepID=UPI002A0A48BA|nr:LysR family transcriptional regulator [uncultured Sphaerochaeta sp.]